MDKNTTNLLSRIKSGLEKSGTLRIQAIKFKQLYPSADAGELEGTVTGLLEQRGWKCEFKDFQRSIDIWDPNNKAYRKGC